MKTKTKTKTATLCVYTPWGTTRKMVDVLYRNKVLYYFFGGTEADMLEAAKKWCRNQGFTNTKINYIVKG